MSDAPSAEGVRPRRLREVRQRIHLAALGLCEARGSAAVTVGEIAEAAEISRRSFFRYFKNKEDAVLAGHTNYQEVARSAPLVVAGEKDALAAVERLGDIVLEQEIGANHSEHRRLNRVIRTDPAIRAYAVAQDRVVSDLLRDRLCEALPEVPEGRLEFIAELGVTVWRHGWIRWCSLPDVDTPETPAESHAIVRAHFRELVR